MRFNALRQKSQVHTANPCYTLSPPGNNEWREPRWPVPMPGEDSPLSPLAWWLLYELRIRPHSPPDLVTQADVCKAQRGARRRIMHDPDVSPRRLTVAFDDLLAHGYVVAVVEV